MRKKAAGRLDEHDQTLEFAVSPVTESETAVLPVIETKAEVEAETQPDEGAKDRRDVTILELRIAELEDKFVILQTELNTLINRKKKKKESKEKKVKCKCKDKKLDIDKCKCKSKELDK